MTKRILTLALLSVLCIAVPAQAAEVVVPGSTVSHEVCKLEASGEGEECETIEEWETSSTTETTTETITTTEESVLSAPLVVAPVVKHHTVHPRRKHHHHHHRAR